MSSLLMSMALEIEVSNIMLESTMIKISKMEAQFLKVEVSAIFISLPAFQS